MAEAVQLESHPPSQSFQFQSQFGDLPIPSMDYLLDDSYLCPTVAESGFGFNDEFADFDSFFNDPNNFYLPGEDEEFFIPDGDRSVHSVSDPSHEVPHIVNVSSSKSNCSGLESNSPDFPAVFSDCKWENSSSPPTELMDNVNGTDRTSNGGDKVSEYGGCDRVSSHGPVSSHGSGNCGSGEYDVMNSMSPDLGHSDQGFCSGTVVDEDHNMVNVNNYLPKRKRKGEVECNLNNSGSSTCKYQRSSTPVEKGNNQRGVEGDVTNGEEDKKKARLMRNRESAQLSRQRKKDYVMELEHKVRSLHSTITDLNCKLSFAMTENATLRQQLSSGICLQPAPGMYPHSPMAPMAYPWIPYAPYVLKSQGPVPLVPIPRLKPQQPESVPKAKKSESKTSGKTKKVASISLMGVLFFFILFGGLVPMVNLKFGGFVDDACGSNNHLRERYLRVHGHINGSEGEKGIGFGGNFDAPDKIGCCKGSGYDPTRHGSRPAVSSSEFDYLGNSSEALVASLYVPRNNKLVKIDGNLIIHSVLATEKSMESRNSIENQDNGKPGLVVAKDHALALAIPEVGRNSDRNPHTYLSTARHQKALAAGAAQSLHDQYKLSASNGKTNQWFLEGLAGPMLSSGMCTEVFRFDVSPTRGAIIPAAAITNVTAVNPQNATKGNKGRNRRILHDLPVSVPRSGNNIAEERVRMSPQKSHLGNASSSSMIVSVLVDPRESGDTGADGMITTKSLSRIFVVVLIDSVKYVTYSCMLPRSAPHMVTS